MTDFTAEQLATIGRRDGSLLVRAGAGTGKTSVLVERFVQAVIEDAAAVDSILAITFTEKAAAEMKTRVRRRFADLGRRDDARAAEGAWISTIHGFCSRVLRAHALTAGIDPDYKVLDELESERLGLDAFDRALEAFLPEGAEPRRLEMVAAYTPDRLREMVRTAWSHLRSRGQRRPTLEPVEPPSAAGERERLAEAAAVALRELGSCGGGRRVSEAMERLERCGGLLEGLESGELAEPAQLDKLAVSRGAGALESDACDAYREALATYARLCADHRQYLDRELLRELLDLYGQELGRLKRARSGLDFEDLELMARDLLADHPGLREQYAGRFSHVLVDEFQDTNPLQNELFDLLCAESMSGASPDGEGPARPRLFLVGDENQSIYGFRNADVEVFREHHRGAAERRRAESLTTNFRAGGRVLDAIDMAFASVWQEFEPLRPGPDAWKEPGEVELLVTDKGRDAWKPLLERDEDLFGPGLGSTPPWRAAEARLLARRISGLHDEFAWGEIVVLLRATTHMQFYERALEERGVPTHVVGGRGYWSQQQVADLRHWLAALANPLDELAVYSVLASPLVGCSLDTLALLGIESRRSRKGVWWTLEEGASNGLLDSLPEDDRARVRKFVALFEEERRAAAGVSLETLIDRAITKTGYDRRVLPLPAGDRRLANVRKLMRMAREFEADEGRDLRAFIDFVGERDLIQEREGEAPLEAEQLDAVRLMTIHRAKGLEFPVVCLADLGKDGREDRGQLRISDDGSLGLRLASLSGKPVNTDELERIKKEQKLKAEEEEKRIFYVAATRAERRLILSGATDLTKLPEEAPLQEPMRWVWRGFCADLPGGEARGVSIGSWDGREVPVAYERLTPETLEQLLPPADRRPARPEPEPAPEESTPPLELAAVPAPRALPVSRLSYSGLARYERCGYRFYLERALRLDSRVEPGAPEPRGSDELPALLRGTVVHELLEKLDMRRPVVPTQTQVEELIVRHDAPLREEDVADVRSLIEGFAASPLRERLARARRVRTELPFAFTLAPNGPGRRSLLVNGVVDVHAAEDDGTLIVDYKSDRLEGADPVEYCEERYGIQRLVYALAALRSGAERAEVAYLFLERPAEPVATTFEASDADTLEAQLRELARGLVEGRFEPTGEPHLELCHDCPGRAALCSWGEERTLKPREG